MIEVFISYAHADEALRDELDKQLSVLKRKGLITTWSDRDIDIGNEWKKEIDQHLQSARLILLLVSADFIASDYRYSIEMKYALEQNDHHKALVIPVILRECLWQTSPLGKLQALPENSRPITSRDWHTQDEAFASVARSIQEKIQKMQLPPPPLPPAVPNPPQPSRDRSRKLPSVLVWAILLIFVLGSLAYFVQYRQYAESTCNPAEWTKVGTVLSSSSLHVTKAPNGECVGISDGSFAFDTNRLDGDLKRQAADEMQKGDIAGAKADWQQALNEDTNDAETLIYQEDRNVLESGHPYITFVILTELTGASDAVGVGHDDLQGAYVEQQEEYNSQMQLPHGVLVRLLIANIDTYLASTTLVAEQIVQASQADRSIVGVIGGAFINTNMTRDAIQVLSKASIPLVSSASTNRSENVSSFFSVAPTIQDQAQAGVAYVEQVLHARRVALFFDQNDLYSNILASSFKKQFLQDSENRTIYAGFYTVGHPEGLYDYVHAALQVNPDLIYFAGYAADATTLIEDLQSITNSPPPVMGGDALYRPGGYPSSVFTSFNRLYFTAAAYPDEWNVLGRKTPSAFFSDYAQDFDPGGQKVENPYGYTRPDSEAILAYDATLTLFFASNNLLNVRKTSITSAELQQALMNIGTPQILQGISGQIDFAPNGVPQNKAVVVLHVINGKNQLAGSSPQQWLWGTF